MLNTEWGAGGGPFHTLRPTLRDLILHGFRPKDVEAYIDIDAINLS
jgi:hypothetical protein